MAVRLEMSDDEDVPDRDGVHPLHSKEVALRSVLA
jgi:hypothetical protein